jgi:uncharacterized membrane protein (Fun14 family)
MNAMIIGRWGAAELSGEEENDVSKGGIQGRAISRFWRAATVFVLLVFSLGLAYRIHALRLEASAARHMEKSLSLGSMSKDMQPVPVPAQPESRPTPERGWTEDLFGKMAPVGTEMGFFFLMGLAVGCTAKKVGKLMGFLLGLFFVSLQGLAYVGMIEIHWEALAEIFRKVLLNIQSQESPLWEIAAHKIPSAGGLLAGLMVGLRRG